VDEEEVPAWAGLGPEGSPPSRGDQSAARRKKRRLITIGAAVVVVAGAVGGYLAFSGNTGPANVVSNDLITTFLPGELQQVPNACDAVSSATMSQYMPGQLKSAAPPLNSGLQSQCTWTLDNPPTYRVLEVDVQAYSPSGLASGDGSATFAAIDAFEEAQTAKQDPGAKSGEPDATITTSQVSGNNAFQAVQVYQSAHAAMYVVTEVVRYRNVLITTVVDGLQESTGTKHYGPVSETELTAQAQAVAQGATAKVIG
jgi:flagellar basal body-associated protein FliL